MIFSHYTSEPRILDDRVYVQQPQLTYPLDGGFEKTLSPYGKPNGLWISADGEDDWLSWCQSENFALERLAHRHIIKILPQANILTLSQPCDLDNFEKKYGIPCEHGFLGYSIDWNLVASEYDGIVIAPYQWECRMKKNWYYTWDCASGCVWNTQIIRVET